MMIETKYNVGDNLFTIGSSFNCQLVDCPVCNGNYEKEIDGVKYVCPKCEKGKVMGPTLQQIEPFVVEKICLHIWKDKVEGYYSDSCGYIRTEGELYDNREDAMKALDKENKAILAQFKKKFK